MTPEGIVVAAVEQYFSQPKFRKFSIKKEDRIRFGSRLGFADVVLIDNKSRRAAIVECKQSGIEGYGPAQLKSYLCATDTPFGIFANSTEPDDWEFYENLGRNQFEENLTRPEFENRVVKSENNVITHMLDFFRGISQLEREESSKIKSDGKVTEPQPSRKSNPPNIIIQDRTLQNGNRENSTIEPSLNGKPYYSEQNGFYWAANHQGIAECLPQHIKRIIHNEEVEIASTRDEIDEEISLLREDVVELDNQRHECDRKIAERTQNLANKKETLAGLQVQLDSLTQRTPDDIAPESDVLSIEGIPDNSVIQRLEEEINGFIQEEAHLTQTIYEKSQMLAQKSEKLAELDVQRHVLTQTDPATIPETLFEEINTFREDKTKLEAQRHECEQEINERTQELANKKEKLAGLQAQSNLLIETGPETLSNTPVTETWIGQWKKWWQTHLGSDTLPIEELPDDSINDFVDESPNDSGKQYLETEIDNLKHQKDGLEQEINQKNEELARAQEDLARLEAELEAPTEIELNHLSEVNSQVNVKKWFSWLSRISSRISARIVAFVATIVLIFLTGYLFVFYASAIDKAFFLNEEEITNQINEGTYSSGIRALVDPKALEKAYQNRNYLVLFGPILFVAFALAVDLLWKPNRRGASITFAVLTFVLDFLLAIHISQKIHLAETEIQAWAMENPNIEKWTLFASSTIFEILTVIFFGFVASLLASILHHVTREQWEQVRHPQPKSKEELIHEAHIKTEKAKRNSRIAEMNTKIGNIQNKIKSLKKKSETIERQIDGCQIKIEEFPKRQRASEIKTVRGSIETQIAVLNVEIDNLQNEISKLTEKDATIQQNLEKLFKQQRETEIKVARLPIETQIAVLNAEIDNLRNEIEQLTERTATAQQNIGGLSKQQRAIEIKVARLPIETQIAVLNAEIDNLQNEINTFKATNANIQKEINEQQSKIKEQLRHRNERVVNLSKMQSQVNQFLNGWFRFIAHSVDEDTNVSDQIERIKQVAEHTLNQYHQGSPDYSS